MLRFSYFFVTFSLLSRYFQVDPRVTFSLLWIFRGFALCGTFCPSQWYFNFALRDSELPRRPADAISRVEWCCSEAGNAPLCGSTRALRLLGSRSRSHLCTENRGAGFPHATKVLPAFFLTGEFATRATLPGQIWCDLICAAPKQQFQDQFSIPNPQVCWFHFLNLVQKEKSLPRNLIPLSKGVKALEIAVGGVFAPTTGSP